MSTLRRLVFWIHLTLGILTGLVGALMAGTGALMAFADSYLDVREHGKRVVNRDADAQAQSLDALAEKVNATHPSTPITRVGVDRSHAYEFYHGKQGLDYVNPYSGVIYPSDSVPLRRTLHKGVEQWHRFLGLEGERKTTGRSIVSWSNVAIIPLLLSGLVLWWPRSLRWKFIRSAILPTKRLKKSGRQRSWHTVIGLWALPFLLTMALTATTHSFAWVRDSVYRLTTSGQGKPNDSLWAPSLPSQPMLADEKPLSLDSLLALANQEFPDWTRLDLFPSSSANSGDRLNTAHLVAKVSGRGPLFFPVTAQVHPYSGKILDVHSWADLSGGTKVLAWARWLHKGEAFGRFGQIIAGIACLAMLLLVYTGWALAIRRLFRRD